MSYATAELPESVLPPIIQEDTLSVTTAQSRRDEGIARVENHAEQLKARWREEAFAALKSFLLERRESFLAESFIDWSRTNRISQPHDGRAWGGVFQRAIKFGLIEKVGFGLAATSNLSPKPLWRRL